LENLCYQIYGAPKDAHREFEYSRGTGQLQKPSLLAAMRVATRLLMTAAFLPLV
jgi:hypothetical protein